jgi:hypothetical protein
MCGRERGEKCGGPGHGVADPELGGAVPAGRGAAEGEKPAGARRDGGGPAEVGLVRQEAGQVERGGCLRLGGAEEVEARGAAAVEAAAGQPLGGVPEEESEEGRGAGAAVGKEGRL